jgi:hypothetical protein
VGGVISHISDQSLIVKLLSGQMQCRFFTDHGSPEGVYSGGQGQGQYFFCCTLLCSVGGIPYCA